jgi:hypothetical protein
MLDEPRLEFLLNAYFDQSLSESEKAELEQMLLSSTRAREAFRKHAEHHGLMREWALRSHGADLVQVARPRAPKPGESPKIVPFPARRLVWIAAGLAACAAGAWLVLQESPLPKKQQSRPRSVDVAYTEKSWSKVALLAEAVDVEWAPGAPAPATGEALAKGWIKINRGILRLDFYSGVRVVLEGPAEFQIISPEEARLDKGKLTAYVTPPAIGFTVHNSEFTVVDRGTEFGMNVSSPNLCEVHVFKGEVALQGGVIKGDEKLLFGGDGVSVRDGKLTSIAPDRHRFVDPELLRSISDKAIGAEYDEWKAGSEAFRSTPQLGAYFDFENIDFAQSILKNRSLSTHRASDGVIIGCEPQAGRWPQKGGLGFARTSDRVRFRMDGTATSLTLLAWVRVDGLPLEHNQLFSVSPREVGEVHWKLNQYGEMETSIRVVNKLSKGSWEILVTPPIIGDKDFGYWLCLATVLDGEKGVIKSFMNGREVASVPWSRIVPIQLGVADLGNLAPYIPGQVVPKESIRNFGGRMDEFALVTRALTSGEIREFSKWPELLRAKLDSPAKAKGD